MLDGKIFIMVLNPNSSTSMTRDIEQSVGKMRLPPDVTFNFVTAAEGAPESINSLTDGVLSANTVFRVNFGGPVFARTVKERSYVDAIVIACFSPHPLVPMLRENHPGFIVIGIYEAAVQTAAQMGLRFGIVTTGAQWESILMHALEYSTGVCKDRCVGVKGTGVAVLALDHSDETRTALLNSSLELLRAGAEAIILGCAGMSPLAKQLQDDILKASPWRSGLSSQYVPIIDGVRAAIEIAASLARQAL